MFLSINLSFYFSIHLWFLISVFLPSYRSIFLYVYLIHLSILPSTHPFIHPSVALSSCVNMILPSWKPNTTNPKEGMRHEKLLTDWQGTLGARKACWMATSSELAPKDPQCALGAGAVPFSKWHVLAWSCCSPIHNDWLNKAGCSRLCQTKLRAPNTCL